MATHAGVPTSMMVVDQGASRQELASAIMHNLMFLSGSSTHIEAYKKLVDGKRALDGSRLTILDAYRATGAGNPNTSSASFRAKQIVLDFFDDIVPIEWASKKRRRVSDSATLEKRRAEVAGTIPAMFNQVKRIRVAEPMKEEGRRDGPTETPKMGEETSDAAPKAVAARAASPAKCTFTVTVCSPAYPGDIARYMVSGGDGCEDVGRDLVSALMYGIGSRGRVLQSRPHKA